MVRAFVTGGAGFIGSWLVDVLLEKGWDVATCDDLSGGDWHNISHLRKLPWGGLAPLTNCKLKVAQDDILDLECLTDDMSDVIIEGEGGIVFHCAALAHEGLSVFSPSTIVDNIVTGSVNAMVAAIRCGAKGFVNCSSMARYGDSVPPFSEEHFPKPRDPYGAAKVAAETQLNILGAIHGVKVLHAVPHNVIGPRQNFTDPYRNVASIFINRMLQGKQPIVHGDGQQTRCFSFIQDVIPVMVGMAERIDEFGHGEIFNLGPDDHQISVLQLAHMIADKLGLRCVVSWQPPRPLEVRDAFCSSEKIRRVFGYETKTCLSDGLDSMIAWIKEQGPKPFRHDLLPIEIVNDKLPRVWKERLM